MITGIYVVFWISTLLLFHAFVGYPLWVWLQGCLYPRPVKRADTSTLPTVTVVMAVHQGERYIRAKLANLLAQDYPTALVDIVVACDGCTDATARLCRDGNDARVRVLEFAARRGKAACLNDAVAIARGDVLLMTDVRQMLDKSALKALVRSLEDPEVGAVSGELCLLDARTGFARGVDAYWKYEKAIRQAESRSGSTVGVSGALYAIRRELFQRLPSNTVLDDVLVPMRVAAAGRRVVFEPGARASDEVSQLPQEERRRKIRTLAGNYQLVQLAPWLLLPWRNPLWFRFVSHKLLRLLAPWLLLGLSASAMILASRDMLCALALLGVMVIAALVASGRLRPAISSWLPVRLATAFFYMNLFAARALFAFRRNQRLHLW